MACSTDLRSRVLALYDDGVKTAAIAKQLMVSPAWARRVEQHRDADPALRRPVGGRKPKLDRAGRDHLAKWVAERPDATLQELRARVAQELKVTVSIGCLFNTLRALKLTFKKKSLVAAEQRERPDVAEARSAFFAEQLRGVPLADVVVTDESYATTRFTRLRGRAPAGERLHEHVPHGHWKRLTILGAMTVAGPLVATTIDAPTCGDTSRTFVDDFLCPALRPGQVVVMDNLAAHKVAGIRASIERVGCRPVYLPPYSPDLSPIEPMWHCRPVRGLQSSPCANKMRTCAFVFPWA